MRLLSLVTTLAFASLLAGCPCPEITEEITFTQSSDGLRYTLEGPYDLVGTLSKSTAEDLTWELEAVLTVPTGGYTVSAPDIVIRESFPEQVVVNIYVETPSPGEAVAQVVGFIPVEAEISASTDASFEGSIISSCSGILLPAS